jgi:glyoxylase-like metal-dependent hydrolase (beta-lactamase superfamily II)
MTRLLLCLALTLVSHAPMRGADIPIEVVRLSPRVAIFYGSPWDNAIVAVAGQKGIVVVDAPFTRTVGAAFREAIQTEFKRKDIAFLVNTHEHDCHVGGNGAFADVPIVGHRSLRDLMTEGPGTAARLQGVGEREVARVRERARKTNPKLLEDPSFLAYEKEWRIIQADLRALPVPVPPTITFEQEMTLHLGDVAVRLHYYGPSHGIADTLVTIPAENLVLTAGIFYPTHVPELDPVVAGSTPEAMDHQLAVLRRILGEADASTKFLASHGRAVMTKAQYQPFLQYLDGVWAGVRRGRSLGLTLDQTAATIPLQDYPELAKLPNENLRGTEWENLDLHRHNIERLWKVLDGAGH